MNRLKFFAILSCMIFAYAYAHAQETHSANSNHVIQSNQTGSESQQITTNKLHIKTNILGLGLAIANIAIEMDFAKHWSVQVPIYYSAWDYFVDGYKFRTAAIQPEVRWWPSRKSNDKFFIGAHAGFAHYNVATNGYYRYQDKDCKTPAIGGGLSIGYRLPLCKNRHWKMEFSVGAGVYPIEYDKFYHVPNGGLLDSEKETYIGLDHAAISVAYMFNLNKKRK